MRLRLWERVVARGLCLIPPATRGKARLARRLLPLRWQRSEMTVRLSGGEELLVPSVHEQVAFNCLIDGTYEPELIKLLPMYLPPGGTFLDIGANVGVFT